MWSIPQPSAVLRRLRRALPGYVGADAYRGKQGDRGTLMQYTVHDLLPEERESLERILNIVEGMTPDERRNLISNVFVAVLHQRRSEDPEILGSLAHDLLGTIHLHSSDAYRKAQANARPRDPDRPARSVQDVLASLPR
jgi:hypothetical protein